VIDCRAPEHAMPPRLHVVTCSTRPTRVGPSVAAWFLDVARAHAGFDVVSIDLAEVGLPMYDEPEHPAKRDYRHDHTRRWSESVAAADAFVFVTPEYNFGPPPPLVNALDYVYHEWHYKPAGFVSYGGISGGLRAVQMEKQLLTALKMMPIPEQVTIPFVAKQIGEGRTFAANDAQARAATTMLDELLRWTQALQPMRAR
jgi:NAD(P)H-dependent FMN reductase